MSFINVWLHLVWTTKNRQPVLSDSIRGTLFQHIRENAREKGIHIDYINGYVDHVHVLVSLGACQTIANVVQQFKGESAHWANQRELVRGGLEWQSEYGAFSVSESGIHAVREYIRNQPKHHRGKTFEREYSEMLRACGFAQGVGTKVPVDIWEI